MNSEELAKQIEKEKEDYAELRKQVDRLKEDVSKRVNKNRNN